MNYFQYFKLFSVFTSAFSTAIVALDPAVDLLLTPRYENNSNEITSIGVSMTLKALSYNAEDLFLTMPTQIANVVCNRYDSQNMKVVDEAGPLPIYTEDLDDEDTRGFFTNQSTNGDITLSFEALPREITETTAPGPRIDLRKDLEGGMSGAGISFIPSPIDNANSTFEINIKWNLTGSPDGTSAVWSFGEQSTLQNNSVSKRGPLSLLTNTIYAVGPLKNYTAQTPLEDGRVREYGFYWFGTPDLFDPNEIAQLVERTFDSLADFFEDTQLSYRIFVKFHPVRGFGGSAFDRSFVLEYDPFVQVSDDELYSLLVHEMVHNWPIMDGMQSGQVEDEATWFTEGVADYYALVLPYKLGTYDDTEYLKRANSEASQYFTNPLVHLSDEEVNKIAWTTANAQTLPYVRGCMHLLDMSSKIMELNASRSIDDIILPFNHLKDLQQPHTLEIWLDLMTNELGPIATTYYEDMAAGRLIIPNQNSLGSKFELYREDHEQFNLGFAEVSLNERVVSGLQNGSRADLAGLEDGDRIIRNSFMFQTMGNFTANMTMLIGRDGEEFEMSYWPRSWEKVECWQWRTKEYLSVKNYPGLQRPI